MRCIQCKNELISGDTNPSQICWQCTENNRQKAILEEQTRHMNFGWICPKCGCSYAPHTPACFKCNGYNQYIVTCNSK